MKKLKSCLQTAYDDIRRPTNTLWFSSARFGPALALQGFRYGHWWVLSAVLAIALCDNPNVPTALAALGCILYLLWKNKPLFVTFTLIFVLMVLDFHWQTVSTTLNSRQTDWIGRVSSIPEINGDRFVAYLRLGKNESVYAVYRIKSREEKQTLSRLTPGMICALRGTLTKPSTAGNFDAFDFRTYLRHKGIHWQLTVDQWATCHEGRISLMERIQQLRQRGIQTVDAKLAPPMSGLINALVFGSQSEMDGGLEEAYRNLGLIHLLAVSGLHVVVVIGLSHRLLIRVGLLKEHVQWLLFLIIIPLYAVLTGLSPSVVRASLMAEWLLFFRIARRAVPTVSALSFACLMQLAYDPGSLFDIGFELSYLITFAIIVSAPTVQKRVQNPLSKTFIITGIAQIAAFPIICYYFYSFSLLSFVLNLFYVPLISFVILPLAIVTVVLLILFPPCGLFVFGFLDMIMTPAHSLLLNCEHLLLFNLIIGRPGAWGLVGISLCAFGLLILWEKWSHPFSIFLPVAFYLVIGFCHVAAQWINPYGSVTFLDVGQGDSILIRFPHRQGAMLIDTGGSLPIKKADWQKRTDPFDVGSDVVSQQIKALGISKIDWLVLTHSDWDHIGGLNGVIDHIRVANIVIGKAFQATNTEKKWFERAKNMGIHIVSVPAGAQWGTKNLYVKVLWPKTAISDSNNGSLVLLAKMGGVHFLFTGDLEKEGEAGLLQQIPNLHVDVLKVGHHGSRTSSSEAFIQAIHPKLAIISVGKNNRFGHPHKEVLAVFKKYHIPILRTDRDGAVRIVFTSNRILQIKHAK
jgi:competence protein ComEC